MAVAKAVEEQAEVELTLVATFGDLEFRADPKDGKTSGPECRKAILTTLRAYREQREELKRTTSRPYVIDSCSNHITACNMLIAAVNAVRKNNDLYEALRQPMDGKPGKKVMLEGPWDLMGFIIRYAEAHFAQTKDVTFPNGKPEAPAKTKAQRSDDAEDETDEMMDDDDADDVTQPQQSLADQFGAVEE